MERIIYGTRRYGILLRLFKLVAREWAQWTSEMSSQTREQIFHLYKQPCIILSNYDDNNYNSKKSM